MKITLYILLALRVIFDGSLNFAILGFTVNGYLSIFLISMAIIVALGEKPRFLGFFILVTLGVFTSATYASLTFGLDPIEEALRLVSVISMFYILINMRNSFSLKSVAYFFGFLSLANSLMGLYQQLTGTGLFVSGVLRYSGFMAHPNTSALLSAIALLALVQLSILNRLSILRIILVLASILGIGLSLSIGGLTMTLVSLFVLLRLNFGTRFQNVLGVLVVSSVIALGYFTGFTDRIQGFANADAYRYGDSTNSLVWRVRHWSQIWRSVLENPFFGHGYGASSSGFLTPDKILPHNEYLRSLLELGIVGTLVGFVILAKILSALRHRFLNGDRVFANLGLSLTLAALVSAVSENTFMYTVPMLMVAVILGTALSPHRPPQVERS